MEELDIHIAEELNKEWTAFLDTIPWQGFGNSIAESNRIFASRRKAWMFRMAKKYNISLSVLSGRYVHD